VADPVSVFGSRQSRSGENRRRRCFANVAIFTKPQPCRELSDRPSVSRRRRDQSPLHFHVAIAGLEDVQGVVQTDQLRSVSKRVVRTPCPLLARSRRHKITASMIVHVNILTNLSDSRLCPVIGDPEWAEASPVTTPPNRAAETESTNTVARLTKGYC
jgi:hypothetical protein